MVGDPQMKLLLTGDWHFTNRQPANRLDDFHATMMTKLEYIFDIAMAGKVDYIIQPGDFFDSHRASDQLKGWIIAKLREHSFKVLTVFGQHDLRFHSSNKMNTPLAVLNASGVVDIMSELPFIIQTGMEPVNVYGSSWGETIPEIPEQIDHQINIWVCHRMVIRDKLWEGQVEYELGNALLRRTPFDLIVSGDNHESFFLQQKDGRVLVNCGSLMRNRIDQSHHKPHFYILDVEKWEFTQKFLPVNDFEKIMDVEKAEKEKVRNEELDNFIEGLSEDVELEGMDFEKNLADYMTAEDLEPGTIKLINEMLGIKDAK